MNLAIKAWEDGHPSRVLQLLESQRPRFDEEDLRGFDWYYLWRLCQGTYRFSLPSFNYDDSASMAISSDGTTLASVDGRTVRLWDVSTGREIGELPGHVEMVNGLAFTPDGTTLAASDGTESVILWDLATRTQRATIKPGQAVSGLQFTADGRTLVLSGKQVKLWDAVANEELARLGESETGFTNVAVAADGSAIVASGSSNFVHIWFQDGGKWREEPSLKATWGFPFLAISPDGKLLAVCSASLLKFYELPTLEERAAPQGHTGRVFAARFTADGKRVASAGEDRTVRFWDVATGQQLACIAHHGPVYGLELTPDGERFASMCTGMVRVWDVSPPAPASVLPQVGPALSLAVSPDGKVVASRGWQKTNLWDVAEGRLIASLPTATAPNQWFRTLAFAPDGESLAFTNGNNVDVTTIRGHRVMVLECNAATNCVTYSPDAKALAVATQSGVVEVWDLATQQRRYSTPAGNRAVVVAFSPDGRTMAAGYQFGVVKLFDSADGRELSTLQRFEFAIDWAYALAFSPDSRKLATGNQQGLVRIWDVATNQIDVTLIGHTDAVKSLAFLDGGRMLATGSDDHTVRLWDVETGQERISLEGHTGALTGVAFAADGGVLVTSSRDGTVRLWRSAVDDHARVPKREVDPEGEQSPVANNEAGDRLWNSGRLREAEAAYRRALARLELLLAAYPEEPRYQYEIVRSLLSISLLLKAERGDLAAAEAARKRAMTLYNQLSPQEQQRMLLVWDERARKLHGSGAAPQAERILIQMIELIPEDDPRLLTRAAHHLAACSDPKLRDTARAVQLTRQAVALSVKDKPAFASALSYLGVALECNGQRAEAAEPYRQANLVWQALSEEERGNVWYRHEWAFFSLTLARILHEAGDLEGAVEYCRTSVRLNEQLVTEFPNVATHADRLGDGHSFLIHVLSALGRNEEAAAVRHDQESFKKQRAAWHEQQRAAAEAEKPSRQANPQQPTPPPTHLARGWAFLNQKQFPEAESAFRDHLQLQPDHAAGLRGLGKALARQNKIAEANSALRSAIKLDPAEFWAHEHLGWVLLKQQELSAAEASFREAVRLQPALESGYRGLGEALKEQNKFQEALIPLREVIRLNATDHQAHSELGWTLFALGQFAEAEGEFRKSIRLKPDSSTTQFGLGRALSEQKKFAESIAPRQASIKADPSNDYGRDALGWAFISLQKFAEAELEFREVIRLKPNLAKGYLGLGRALVEQGKYSHAEAALREAIRLEPTHPRARQMLGRALAGQGRTANAEALKKEESDQTRSEPAKKKPRE